jgi:hypothetical protein
MLPKQFVPRWHIRDSNLFNKKSESIVMLRQLKGNIPLTIVNVITNSRSENLTDVRRNIKHLERIEPHQLSFQKLMFVPVPSSHKI